MGDYQRTLADAAATEALGARMAACATAGLVIHLHGDLGAGKTTFTRGMLRALGHDGPVRSPTYTLVEPYEVGGRRLYHFDLYRLGDPEELEFMGIRDYTDGEAILVVEWPEQGQGVLPGPDLDVYLQHQGPGRRVSLQPRTPAGEVVLACLSADIHR